MVMITLRSQCVANSYGTTSAQRRYNDVGAATLERRQSSDVTTASGQSRYNDVRGATLQRRRDSDVTTTSAV